MDLQTKMTPTKHKLLEPQTHSNTINGIWPTKILEQHTTKERIFYCGAGHLLVYTVHHKRHIGIAAVLLPPLGHRQSCCNLHLQIFTHFHLKRYKWNNAHACLIPQLTCS